MRYDLASSSWRTSEATSLWDLEMSSPTFPEWGTTRRGELYELPTPERRMDALASSSLPTPTARDWKERAPTYYFRDGVLQVDLLPRAIWALLPTPKAGDGERGRDLPRLREDEKSRELATVAGSIGASTSQPSDDGNGSPGPHPSPPSPATTDDHDSALFSWSGSWD
jgi:hypothetical protein